MNLNLQMLSQLLKPMAGLSNPQLQQPYPTSPDIGVMDQSMIDQNPNRNPLGEDDELSRAMLALLNPRDEQYDRFTQMLQMMPRREDYKPTTGRKITAALAGLGTASPLGISGGHPIGFRADIPSSQKIQQGMLDKPFNTAMGDWTDKASPLLEASKLENSRNTNSRIAGSNVLSSHLRERGIENQASRYETLSRQGDERNRIAAERADTARQNADTADYKARNPNKQFKDANGFLVAIDPVTGVGELVRDSDGQPIETGKLDDRTKIELQLEKAKELEGIRQGNRIAAQENAQGNTLESITARANAPARAAVTRPETPAAKQQRIYNKAVEAVNKHPEWREYIDIDKVRKVPDILTPQAKAGGWLSKPAKGGDPRVTQEILKFIYGDEASESTKPKEAPKAPKGWKYVKKPDGSGWTAVEDK